MVKKTVQRSVGKLMRATATLSLCQIGGVRGLSLSSSIISSLLKDPSIILPSSPFISSSSSRHYDVYNPASDGQVIGEVPIFTQSDVNKAIQRSEKAFNEWSTKTTGQYRGSLLTHFSKLIQQHKQDIATIMTLESGKPMPESLAELNYATSFLDYYAAEAIRPSSTGGGFLTPTTFITPDNPSSNHSYSSPRGKLIAQYQPIGPCALITPWNFPAAMITRKLGPALAAGCTALIKPSELTPFTAIALQTLADRAGIPEGVVQTLTTDTHNTPAVGHQLCTNPAVRKLSFTGSTNVGKLLMRDSASTVKKLSLELGGNAPFVVFDDADVDQAVTAAIASKFRNAGQTCVCADRFLVQDAVYDTFVQKFKTATQDIVLGNGINEGVTMGPLISEKAADGVHAKVLAAIQEGAKCVLGGNKMPTLGRQFYEPTILLDVSLDSEIWNSETFGPVAAIRSFKTEQEALEIANDSSVGLASYFCSKDLSRVFRFSRALETGIVGINDGIISTATAPFGGVKESGLGREGSSMGIAEYLETKYIFLNC